MVDNNPPRWLAGLALLLALALLTCAGAQDKLTSIQGCGEWQFGSDIAVEATDELESLHGVDGWLDANPSPRVGFWKAFDQETWYEVSADKYPATMARYYVDGKLVAMQFQFDEASLEAFRSLDEWVRSLYEIDNHSIMAKGPEVIDQVTFVDRSGQWIEQGFTVTASRLFNPEQGADIQLQLFQQEKGEKDSPLCAYLELWYCADGYYEYWSSGRVSSSDGSVGQDT